MGRRRGEFHRGCRSRRPQLQAVPRNRGDSFSDRKRDGWQENLQGIDRQRVSIVTVKVKVRKFQGRERLSVSFLPPSPLLGFSIIMVGMTMTASMTMATKTAIMEVLMKHHT